ncbi:ABC transporter permease [Amycolatopsis pithecellobii]|uniref:ABC transporter permease subunit n=1 Tax=Amycolatopsis pithecellobii TaxID=664692 RepID=A0A6N7YV36_9PSEU|nr:ABC transporter permease [Amycolatopsis pithecellobii]MTD52733.1 ABC transporter permease subunit [Amycolatopsis pithecellobii]
MGRLIRRRLLLSVPLVLVVSILTFVLQSLTPGDAARTILGTDFDPAQYAMLRQKLGLDEPLWERYWNWLQQLFHGSLGDSLFSGQAVTEALNERLGVTLSLIVATVLLAGMTGIGLGVLSATRRNGLLARTVDVLSLVGEALPSFWVGLLLIAGFAVLWQIFPATGYIAPADSIGGWAWSLVLPVVTLSLGAVAVIAKQTRDSMMDILDREFVSALRARGIAESSIVFRHALRAAAIPVVTVLGLLFVHLLSGTVLVETVFGLPGLGGLAVQATTQHDMPMIQGAAVYFTLIVVVVNLLIDITYGWLNPKARTS